MIVINRTNNLNIINNINSDLTAKRSGREDCAE